MIQTTAKEFIKNPYPGIRSFDTGEGSLFFGREKHTYDLLKVLTQSHFIVISGASGSGKSSLVKAGLIPELKKVSARWSSLIFRPGNRPLDNMADGLLDILLEFGIDNKLTGSYKDIEKLLKSGTEQIIDFFSKVNFTDSILIYIDQFEEIFRYRDDEYITNSKQESEYFVNLLIELSKQRRHPIYVVLSMRTDFLSDCTEFGQLPDMINDGHYLIPKMTTEEKEEAIKGPARYAGATISEELGSLLRQHIIAYDVGLPVLQHALMRTWDYWLINAEQNQPIDVEHYLAIGTVTDALSVHAEQIYGSLPNAELKKLTEKIFKSLTQLGEDNRGIRRPAKLEEICMITGAHEEDVVTVIDAFRAEGHSFLMPPFYQLIKPTSIIDISHESIMRVWKRLSVWVSEENESAQLYLRLSKSAELYQDGKTGLLVNPDLQIAMKWREENAPNEIWAMRYDPAFERTMAYLEFSKKEWDKAIAAKEERQKRNIRRTRNVAIFMGIASLVSITFLIVALNLKLKAEASEKKARESEKLAILESILAEEQKKEAISHKKIAEQQQMIADEQRRMAEEQRLFAFQQRQEAFFQRTVAIKAKGEADMARDKSRLLQIEAENLRDTALTEKERAEIQKSRAEVSEARTDTLRRLAIAKSLAVQSIKVFQNNKKTKALSQEQADLPLILAYQSYYFNRKYKGNPNDPDIYLAMTEVSNSSIGLRGQNYHTDAIRDIAISPDGQWFVSGSDDGSLKVVDLTNTSNPTTLRNPKKDAKNIFRSVAIVDKGKYIAAGDYYGQILIWSKSTGALTAILAGHNSAVNKLLYMNQAEKLISVSNDGTIRIWNIANFQQQPELILKAGERFIAAALSPDQKRLAVGSDKGSIRIFNTENNKQISTIISRESKISSIAWVNNLDFVIGYASGKIEIRQNNDIKEWIAHQSGITDIDFDYTNNRMITCSYDAKIKIWDYSNTEIEPAVIEGHSTWVYRVAFNKSNSTVVSGSADKSILITKLDIEDLKGIIRKKISENMSYKNWLYYVGNDIEYSKKLP
jgi:WD40 repeat protein/energy-coupling factor transporter ATP-binding protein EcfA2